jgi:hypothetical protein
VSIVVCKGISALILGLITFLERINVVGMAEGGSIRLVEALDSTCARVEVVTEIDIEVVVCLVAAWFPMLAALSPVAYLAVVSSVGVSVADTCEKVFTGMDMSPETAGDSVFGMVGNLVNRDALETCGIEETSRIGRSVDVPAAVEGSITAAVV